MRSNSVLLIIICFLLTACDASMPAYDSNIAAAQLQATSGYLTAEAKSTADEQRRVEREATREAARTQQASEAQVAAIEAEIRGTDIAANVERTSTAIAYGMEFQRAQATQQAQGTATAWPQTATPLAATQIAVVARADYENARANLGVVADIIKFVSAMVIMGWTIATIVKAFTNRYRVANTVFGVVSFDPGVQLLAANSPPAAPVVNARFREIPGVVSLNRSGTVLASPPMSNEERDRRNLINLLKACNTIMGAGSNRLPRWDKIPGMTSEKMQRYVDILEQMGYVTVSPSVGTFLVGGSVDAVIYDLETNVKLPHLSPAD